jgi:putative ABC transport system substrate-binding protein
MVKEFRPKGQNLTFQPPGSPPSSPWSAPCAASRLIPPGRRAGWPALALRQAVHPTPDIRSGESTIAEVKSAAAAIGRQIDVLSATTNLEIDTAFASLAQKRADALLVAPQILFSTRRVQLITLAARHAVPTMYHQREHVEAGGLMSYGSSIMDRERLLGVYTGRILKGEKPADLPILRAVKFEFVINLKTAKALGLDLSASVLARADEVIE